MNPLRWLDRLPLYGFSFSNNVSSSLSMSVSLIMLEFKNLPETKTIKVSVSNSLIIPILL